MAETLSRIAKPAPSKVKWSKSDSLLFHTSLLLAALAMGEALLAFGPRWARSIFATVHLDSPRGIGAVCAALLLGVLVHELGHLAAALALDFEILGISLGPLRWRWLHGRSAVQFSWKRLLTCSVSAVPRHVKTNWRGQMLLVIGAGPAATLVILAVSLVLALSSVHQAPNATWLRSFWSASAELNFFLFALGLIPNGSGAHIRNDAALFSLVLLNDKDAQDLKVRHKLLELTLSAVRPCDYPDLMSELARWRGCAETNWLIAKNMMDWAIDSGDLNMADAWDQQAMTQVEQCERITRNTALAESACFDVLFRHNMKDARCKFAEVEFQSLFPPCLAERSRAARLVANDLPHWAFRNILRAQYALPQGLAYYDYERSLLARLHALAMERGIPA